MAWYAIGERARCAGRPLFGTRADGRESRRRCRTALHVGAWFWLEGSKPYCEACALDDDQPINAHRRGEAPTVEWQRQRAALAAGADARTKRAYPGRDSVDRRHQADVDRR